jgi:hypothetical protein
LDEAEARASIVDQVGILISTFDHRSGMIGLPTSRSQA